MAKGKLAIGFLILSLCSLALPGCDRSAKERDKAIAEADQAKAELARVEATLEEIQSERDELKANLAAVSESWGKADSELTAELARVEAALEEIQSERDELKENLAAVSENWGKADSELTAVTQTHDDLLDQINKLTNERDTAVAEAGDFEAMVKKLTEQLQDKIEEVYEYEQWVKELQATIEDLEGQVPDVEFIPTPQDVVDKMLELANIKKDDLVYDLGCGDGRIVVTAAKRYGCKAVGYDIDPQRVKESLENVEKNNVGHLVRIQQKNIFTLDLSKADVITLYLLPELNVELIPQLEKLKPGSRIVSHDFGMEGVQPDKVITVNSNENEDEHEIYLWISPLKKIPD
jgi:tRNA/tmRNA/rRNA uracil-C5-methylase (TrmA/RlmC/RlmD family)